MLDSNFLCYFSYPGIRVAEFTQADLAASNILYVHTSDSEVYMDSFAFSVSDGTNMVTQTFSLNISPVDDSLPLVTNTGLQVQEGVRKLITSFDLAAVDPDTKVCLDDILSHQQFKFPTY